MISWVGGIGAASLVPLTGGLSLLVTASVAAGNYASIGQCAVSVIRTASEYALPEFNDFLDDSWVYQLLATSAELIGYASVAGTATVTLRAVHMMQKATGRPMLQILRDCRVLSVVG